MHFKANTISILVLLCILFVIQGNAQKIDTIYHTNGNILTGDFKKLNYGVVTWKMDGMGTILLETPQILNIKSQKQFEVKLKNGLIYFGSFDTTAVERMVKLVFTNGSKLLNVDDLVEVYPIRKSFWLRTSGNVSLGFNYTLGSDIATLAFSGNLDYKKRKSTYKINWDNNNTFQADTLSATNINFSAGYERVLKNSWSLGTMFGGSQNSQLGVKLRLNLAAIGIRDIVYNWWNRYMVGAGLSVQRETSFEDIEERADLAGIITTAWKVYKYTNPKVWVDADLSFIPYVTGDWRYRVNFNLNPKVGIVGNDLQLGFKFYYTFDNRPPTETSNTFDYGLNLEITYSFH